MSFTLLGLLCPLVFTPVQAPATPGDPYGLGYDLRLAPGESLLAYRWDGGSRVPFLTADPLVRIVFGERGLDDRTQLYLPGHNLLESVSTGAHVLASRNIAIVPEGRFGQALGFDPSSFLQLALPPAELHAGGWTASFWVRPQSASLGRSLVLIPGAVEVRWRSDGRVLAALLPTGEQLTSVAVLAPDLWSFVLVSYDPLLTRQIRLFVNGTSVRANLAVGAPPREPSQVLVGDLALNGRGFVGALDELAFDPFPVSTAGARKLHARSPAVGNRALELTTTRGIRVAQPAAGATRELVLDTPAELAAGALRGATVANGVLRWAPGRWRDLAPRCAPAPRTTHALVALGDQRMFTFGGETRDTHHWPGLNTADTWIYDGRTNTWERVESVVAPSPRCHVPSAYSPDHDLVLLAGGWWNESQPYAVYGDTWVFHVGTRQWEQRFPAGDPLGVGSDYGLVYLPARGRFLLLHGLRNALYDPVANRWDRMPAARVIDENGTPVTTFLVGASPMCALDPVTGLVVVFGSSSGPSQNVFSDTTALYDVSTNTYTVLATPTRPAGRVRSGFAYDSRRKHFVLFGGALDQYSPRFDDLWAFEPVTRRWQELECSERPTPRGGYYGMAYDDEADRFLLFGGRESPDLWLDETLALELDPYRPGTALYTFDRGSAPAPNAWFADVTTPADSEVRFLFRASASGGDWGAWKRTTASFAGSRFLQAVAVFRPGSHGEVPTLQRMGLR